MEESNKKRKVDEVYPKAEAKTEGATEQQQQQEYTPDTQNHAPSSDLTNPTTTSTTTNDSHSNTTTNNGAARNSDMDKDKIAKLLQPFTREQLVEILSSAASQYENIYNEIKTVASADVAHRKVFVRGLAWETTTERLSEAFADYGAVEEAAVIFDKNTGKSRGYGFVTFYEMESAQRAIQQQYREIDGRQTVCNLAAIRPDEQHSSHKPNFRGPHQFHGNNNNNNNHNNAGQPGDEVDRKLFVRGLSWDTTNETFRMEFQKFGEIEDATIARDRGTGKSKGFGFVTYRHKSSADRALQQPQKVIDGRATYCNLACQGSSRGPSDKNRAPIVQQQPAVAANVPPVVGGVPGYGVPIQQPGIYAPAPYVPPPAQPAMAPTQNTYAQYGIQEPYNQQYANPYYSARVEYPPQNVAPAKPQPHHRK